MFGLSDPCSDCLSCFGNKKIGVARSCGKSLFALQLVLAALALPRTFSGWSLHKSILALWSLCTCWVCPHQVPFFFGLSFFLPQKTPRGSQGPVAGLPGCLTEEVLFNRKACGSQGKREEDIINHELLKASREKGALARAVRVELK